LQQALKPLELFILAVLLTKNSGDFFVAKSQNLHLDISQNLPWRLQVEGKYFLKERKV